ncbi:MAG TPA: tripartite tricarboxylate transporter substrate-binding protein [Xanthobacteraceae bacterium]|nr:tripartite tricarboxylate transporter substrate-binding protein [Xanthobacteraceae bacterium]
MKSIAIGVALTLAVGIVVGTARAEADDVADFYNGKTVKLVVGSGVGAGYDNFARATVRYLRLPGNPQIVVQNMPGASGLIAANHLFNVAPKDGTVIGLINRYTVVQAIVDNKNVRFDPPKFTWLGTPASYDEDPYVLIVRSDHPLKTVEDIRAAKEPLIVGGSGSDVARILGPALGMNVKVIEYKEKNAVDIALDRGEVDAMGIAYDNLRKRHPDWLEKKMVRPLVQFVRNRTARLPDVAASSELVSRPEQRALLNFVEIPLSMAYPFVVPPGVPAERVAAIKKAFEVAFNDPAYRAEIEKQGLAYSPRSGEEVANLVKELTEAPETAIQSYRTAVGAGRGD